MLGKFDLHFDPGAYVRGPIVALIGQDEWQPYRHDRPEMDPSTPSKALAAKAAAADVKLTNWVQEVRLVPPPGMPLDEFSTRLGEQVGREIPPGAPGDTAVWFFMSCWSALPVDTLSALGDFLGGLGGDLSTASMAVRVVAFDDWAEGREGPAPESPVPSEETPDA